MTSELQIQNQILKKLRALDGGYFIKIHDIITMGLPDIIGVYKGRFIAIEVKRPGKKPTALQALILNKIQSAGGLAYWTDNSKIINSWIANWCLFKPI